MAKRKSKKRGGCAGLIPLTALAFGALACAWSFYLGKTQAGQEVSLSTGLTFYAGWICGMGLTLISFIAYIFLAVLRLATGAVDKVSDGVSGKDSGLSKLIPGGGSLMSVGTLGAVASFLRKRD